MSEPVSTESQTPKSEFLRLEDWWAVWIGALLLLLAAVHVVGAVPKPGDWTSNPLEAFPDMSLVWHAVLFLGLAMVTGVAVAVMGGDLARYVKGFALVFLLTLLAQLIGGQATLDRLGLEYALWALLIGLLISNTVGAPDWLMAGARSELFIKAGLVLLGAEVLANRIAELGARGLVVAWLVTPVAIIFMWFFGTRILRITSKSLVMVIACCTSVCGVSAAIASAAACRAKKEELSLAVGMTMIFTVAMMLGMPVLCKLMGLDEYVGGAWIGGTVDSTGAVVVSGEILGETAGKVAAVVKMIQNTLIGIIAFIIAVYWVTVVERDESGARPSMMTIWHRFPKFVLGFLAASLIFSFILSPLTGADGVKEITGVTKVFRGWFFALAFTSIGLESNFRNFADQLAGGKPIVLYAVGQTFNVVLTLLAAWLAFGGVLFPAPG